MRTRGSPKAGERCQLAVIGAGPAGLAAAEFAARRGYRVLLFEARRVGGTSLNTGSVPSKALIRSATLLAAIREVARLQDAAQPQPLGLDHVVFDRLDGLNRDLIRNLRQPDSR